MPRSFVARFRRENRDDLRDLDRGAVLAGVLHLRRTAACLFGDVIQHTTELVDLTRVEALDVDAQRPLALADLLHVVDPQAVSGFVLGSQLLEEDPGELLEGAYAFVR